MILSMLEPILGLKNGASIHRTKVLIWRNNFSVRPQLELETVPAW